MANITDIERIENMIQTDKFKGLKMKRINFNGYRLYIEDDPFAYYSGLTGALNAAAFVGNKEIKRRTKWRESMVDSLGLENANNYLEMMADFGTLTHRVLITIKEKGCLNWNEERDTAAEYFLNAYKAKSLEPNIKVMKLQVYEYQKHAASLMQFCYERVESIFAVETPAKHEELKICTPVDIFCSCRQTPKGAFGLTTINVKTSSQISDHQLEQAAVEMIMWNKTYEMKAENTAILRTVDWKEKTGTPTFDYEYMPAKEVEELYIDVSKRLWLCLNDKKSSYFPNPVNKSFKGITKLGEKPEIIISTLQEEWEEAKKSFEEQLPII